jgi:hypothetical protein
MVSSSAKSIEWSKRLERFKRSGLSLTQFCKQENVGVQSFYYWKKHLATEERQRSIDRVPATKPDDAAHDMRVRCTVHAGAVRIECHIESPQALNAILSWAASQQGNSQQSPSLFHQLVVQD